MDINVRAKELFELHKTKKKVSAWLTVEGFGNKDIEGALNELGATTNRGFTGQFYDFLAVKKRTEEEALAFIEGTDGHADTSKNTKNHKTHFLAILELSRRIWDTKEIDVEAEKLKVDIEGAWAFYTEQNTKFEEGGTFTKGQKAKIHPDKFSALGDADLIKAFNDLLGNINAKTTRKAA